MGAFKMSCRVEAEAIASILPFVETMAKAGRYVLTHKGNASAFIQKTVGDVLFNGEDDRLWTLEVKAEATGKWGNFFLETWSNKEFGFQSVGWMYTLRCDILGYYFCDTRRFYSIPFRRLWDWAFVGNRLRDFPEKKQAKYEQRNVTWGVCVPVKVIEQEVGARCYDLSAFGDDNDVVDEVLRPNIA